MIGLFSIANVLVSTIYPVIASYRAIENYSKVAKRMAASNITIAGINVPILGLLLKASGDSSDPLGKDQEILETQIISIQKWFIYWIVSASASLVESLLFIKYVVPFYLFLRFLFSAWLVWPMFISNQRPLGTSGLHRNGDWEHFTQNGSGLVYFKILKPWLDGELSLLSKLPLDPQELIARYGNKIGYARLAKLVYLIYGAEPGQEDLNGGILNTIKSYMFDPSVDRSQPGSLSSKSADLVEEYDMVDKPEPKEGLTQRKTESSPQSKKGWIW